MSDIFIAYVPKIAGVVSVIIFTFMLYFIFLVVIKKNTDEGTYWASKKFLNWVLGISISSSIIIAIIFS